MVQQLTPFPWGCKLLWGTWVGQSNADGAAFLSPINVFLAWWSSRDELCFSYVIPPISAQDLLTLVNVFKTETVGTTLKWFTFLKAIVPIKEWVIFCTYEWTTLWRVECFPSQLISMQENTALRLTHPKISRYNFPLILQVRWIFQAGQRPQDIFTWIVIANREMCMSWLENTLWNATIGPQSCFVLYH